MFRSTVIEACPGTRQHAGQRIRRQGFEADDIVEIVENEGISIEAKDSLLVSSTHLWQADEFRLMG